jgi:hypothetical protein
MKSDLQLSSVEDIDRKRTILSFAGGLGISLGSFFLFFLFWANLIPLCLRVVSRVPVISGSFAMSMLPVILLLAVMLGVFFGTVLQEQRRRHRRSIS